MTATERLTRQLISPLPGPDALVLCEHCGKELRMGDSLPSWCLNLICEECAAKEAQS